MSIGTVRPGLSGPSTPLSFATLTDLYAAAAANGGQSVGAVVNVAGAVYAWDSALSRYSRRREIIRSLKTSQRPLFAFIGDSITAGKDVPDATTLNAGSWCERSATLINAANYADVATCGLVVPNSKISSTPNTQWTVSGWNTVAFGFAGNACYTDSDGGTLTANPIVQNRPFDTIRILVIRNTTHGTVTFTPSGGTPVVVNLSTLPVGIGWIDVPLAKPTLAATVAITRTDGAVYIVGYGVYNSKSREILFANLGIAGSATSHWIDSASLKSFETIAAVQPSAASIMLGRNDIIAGRSASQFGDDLTTLVRQCQKYGPVVVASIVPSNSASALAHDAEYCTTMQSVCAATGSEYLPVFEQAFSSQYQPDLMVNSVHPNGAGQDAIAALWASWWNV